MRIIVPHILLSCHFEVFQATFIHQRWLKISIYSNALGKLCHRHVISLSSLSCLYTAKNKRIPDEQHVLIPAVSFSLRFLLLLLFLYSPIWQLGRISPRQPSSTWCLPDELDKLWVPRQSAGGVPWEGKTWSPKHLEGIRMEKAAVRVLEQDGARLDSTSSQRAAHQDTDLGLLKEFVSGLVSQAHSNPDVLLRELGIGR